MRTKLVIANWKLHGNFLFNEQQLGALSKGLKSHKLDRQVVVCPPVIYLQQCAGLLADSTIALGAQDVSDQISGAYTGETSAVMLKELGCRYVLVGHSERRIRHAETDDVVANKALAAIQSGLTPVVCVGETLVEREQGLTEKVVGRQFKAVVSALGDKLAQIVIAYEPVWAIGTGKTATAEQAQDVHRFLRYELANVDAEIASKIAILYGGSVKADNAAELFAMPDIDGGLVGGASLDAAEFLQICLAR